MLSEGKCVSLATISPGTMLTSSGQRAAAFSMALILGVFMSSAWISGERPIVTTSGAMLVVLLTVTAYTDARWRKIPNWATYSAVLWALMLNAVGQFGDTGQRLAAGLGTIGLADALQGLAICFAVGFIVYRITGGGAGDVKLAAAIGALTGPTVGLGALAWGYIAAGAFALACLVWQCGPLGVVCVLWRRLAPRRSSDPASQRTATELAVLGKTIPMAPFMAVGSLIAVNNGSLGW
jgi:prepilin peptidase CpaA